MIDEKNEQGVLGKIFSSGFFGLFGSKDSNSAEENHKVQQSEMSYTEETSSHEDVSSSQITHTL